MNVYAIFADHVREAVAALSAEGLIKAGLDLARVVVEPPRDASHGDLATNAAMVLSKDAGLKPRDLAEKIAGKLQAVPGVARVDVAGPGFINIALDAAFWPKVLAAALTQGLDFGRSTFGAGEKVNVEYVSANPTGPMHVGHCRGAVFGDAHGEPARLRRALTSPSEYYINDAGAQVDVLARSAFLRYREALGERIGGRFRKGFIPATIWFPSGRQLAEHAWRRIACADKPEMGLAARWCAQAAIDGMMAMIRDDLAALGVESTTCSSPSARWPSARDGNSNAVHADD